MGRKSKLGKRRKDKFYHLAKETGYRARSAFKLIQLNRKYQFLQESRVLVDLCAAPGGWLQVAVKHMPVSSLIVGVDLVPIKPIPSVITIQEDITTGRCRQELQKELKTWKADCILHDGAPNVGSAWVQDAFSQATLTLSALKLTCDLLRAGGWFITKLFRSKDYQPLMWVLQQLFKKVHATKPQASRIESAEIFVVCQGYLAPGKIDPKLLDAKHVFQEVEEEGKQEQKISLVKLQKAPKVAEGYPDGSRTLFKQTSVADFIMGENHLTQLASTNQLVFDKTSEVFSKHPLTTSDIRLLCEDVKVLGPRELKQLVKWREKLRKFLEEVGSEGEEDEEKKMEGVVEEEEEEGVGDLAKVDAKVKVLEEEEAAEVKRERKRLRKAKRRIKERLIKKADTHREVGEIIRQEELFKLKAIKSQSQLEEVGKGEMVAMEAEVDDTAGNEVEGSDSEGEDLSSEGSEDEADELSPRGTANPLVVPLESSSTVRSKKMKMWFGKSEFADLETERDEDEEIKLMVKSFKDKGGQLTSKEDSVNSAGRKDGSVDDGDSSDRDEQREREMDADLLSEDSNSSDETEDKMEEGSSAAASIVKKLKGDTFEVVSTELRAPTRRKLDPEGLAIGALMVQSKKKREDLIESGFNRWSNNDEGLPDWFVEEENKFCQKQLPITKEMVDEYRRKLREINARPIKKIAEAKARKKHRALKKLQKARKQAEGISDIDMSAQEKNQQLRQIYKKAGLMGKKKKEVQYVVAKRGLGKRSRPVGVKGHYKMVDARMKKDKRAMSQKQNKKRK